MEGLTVVEDHLEVAGSVAVVTGGVGGIGRSIASALLRRGATVVIADVEEPALGDTVGELSALGPVSGVRTDVSDEASVYAASKAAVSCFTEALQLNLVKEGTAVRASVFYPSGGLTDTGLYTAARNRPEHPQRRGAGTGRTGFTFEQLKERVASATGSEPKVADVGELGEFAVAGALRRDFIIARDLEGTAELLRRRADAIGRAELPPQHRLGI